MTPFLKKLIEKAKNRFVSDEERNAQRRSFAYGNTKLHNDSITRELIDEVADKQEPDRKLVEGE